MFHAIPYAEEFAIQKRALDVALKGYSDVKQPKRKAGSISVKRASFKSNAKSGMQLISKTREEQKHILEGLDELIHTEIKHIKSLIGEPSDVEVKKITDAEKPEVCSAMRSIKLHQKEYVRVLRVIEGLKVIEMGMQDGFLDPRKVAKCLNEILKVLWKSRAHSQSQKVIASDSKLLAQLRAEEFYPYLKSKYPGRVFFKATKPKTPAEIEQESLLVKARRSSTSTTDSASKPLSSTDGSSMPALSSICSESVVTVSVFGDSQYSYAASEVSSAPNSPTLGSSRNRHHLGFKDLNPGIDTRDILIPALALQHPETIILDVLSPTLDSILPKERPSRWDNLNLSSERSASPERQMTGTLHDSAQTTRRSPLPPPRDCVPTVARRSDSFIDIDEPNVGLDVILSDKSLDVIPNLPKRRGSGDSDIRKPLRV